LEQKQPSLFESAAKKSSIVRSEDESPKSQKLAALKMSVKEQFSARASKEQESRY
jgi:hypothetical protein